MISDGQPVNASASNAAWMSRTSDTSTIGKVALSESGSTAILDSQKLINNLMSDVGRSAEIDTNSKVYTSNEVITNGDDRKQAIQKLDAEFNMTTGHDHSGAAGQGKPVSAANLVEFNKFFAEFQSVNFASASGLSTDVSSAFVGKTSGGGVSTLGVVTTPPNNQCVLVNSSTFDFLEDAGGQRIYGRITYSIPTWTLTYFTNELGVETAHNLVNTNIKIIFWEVFNQNTRPTFPSNPLEFGTLDVTGDVIDGSLTNRGVLNPTGTQTIGGAKVWANTNTFQDNVLLQKSIYGSFTTDNTTTGALVTVASDDKIIRKYTGAITSIKGLVPQGTNTEIRIWINHTGSNVLIKHNNDTINGFLIADNQDYIWRDHTSLLLMYSSVDQRWFLLGFHGNQFDLQTVGASPNADGATYNVNTGDFTLQPANDTSPGILSTLDQLLPSGDKIFKNNLGLSQIAFNTSGSNIQITPSSSTYYNLTHASLVSVERIALGTLAGYGILKVITNNTGVQVTILNDTGSPTNERVITGTGANLTLENNASLLLIYNTTLSKWCVVGGSGSGGSSGYNTAPSIQSIAASGSITISLTEKFQFLKVKGATAGTIVQASGTAFGASAPVGGSVLKVLGTSDTDKLKLVYADVSNGLLVNGDAILGLNNMIEFIYDNIAQRFIECSRNF